MGPGPCLPAIVSFPKNKNKIMLPESLQDARSNLHFLFSATTSFSAVRAGSFNSGIMSVVDALHSMLGLQSFGSLHITIGVAAVFVFALVASVVLLSMQKGKLDFDKGVLSYVKFVYSCFLKPHERDHDGESGQQHALESFYRTQVGHCKWQQGRFRR